MVYGKSFFPDIRYYVVQVDISTPAYWSIIKFRMEIFIADQYV